MLEGEKNNSLLKINDKFKIILLGFSYNTNS